MKLVFILEDEAWFWLWNEDTQRWEAWYENNVTPAERIPHSDRPTTAHVTAIMTEMTNSALWEIWSHADESLNK